MILSEGRIGLRSRFRQGSFPGPVDAWLECSSKKRLFWQCPPILLVQLEGVIGEKIKRGLVEEGNNEAPPAGISWSQPRAFSAHESVWVGGYLHLGVSCVGRHRTLVCFFSSGSRNARLAGFYIVRRGSRGCGDAERARLHSAAPNRPQPLERRRLENMGIDSRTLQSKSANCAVSPVIDIRQGGA